MISFQQVTKKYRQKAALQEVNLELTRGKIIGLVGENGSGKSTTLKLIAGLIYPTKGEVLVNGNKVSRRIASSVSYLSELDEYYRFYNVEQTIEFYASQFPDFDPKKAYEILTFMKLDPESKLKQLSKGNRGRLKIVLSLARNVPVILMDEPLSGLDPMVRQSIVKGLISFIDLERQLVLITTHEVREVENILDEVIAIKEGKIIGHHNVEQLREEENLSIVDWMTKVYES
ncbi:ABC transporter ATP-binding protein [Halalkalibacterium halodurans]|jgi:ABC-2 type transport system ATP-binding protein|uniref:ABC transporter (ATP-binding protein) n=2 Tax=Halalkalibacterium halodurans TaxID=86665 RepID=Q7AJY8_HALH5|nr:ABC transporter ATP-binding protein [Halalkalibacterium halodurans]MED4082565.1 ABC transporter ATP-binding protein [Halalkalibacterium halodurans]MED4085810.1 ABC transporter ATP-binding protein [Halalkalibacterium halodurans]MED4105676.1 ABC transporter ATP-binding protein [Halalkalibacterium halodurans]MED4107451.1 ABC transporter ATP-binding protein [Halalkalibacterium halodurans]MED4125126.1 ABC transporter ATP-binding protein [Halalkalibacterium halodurans]